MGAYPRRERAGNWRSGFAPGRSRCACRRILRAYPFSRDSHARNGRMTTTQKSGGIGAVSSRRRARILIADDNKDTRDIVEHILLPFGAEVLVAKDGEQALAMWETAGPDLAILDVMMPGVDGIELCKLIKTDMVRLNRFIPVLLLTALGRPANVTAGLDAGADEYVAKPFDPDELRARVRALLRIKALQDELAISRDELAESRLKLEENNRELEERIREQVTDLVKLSRLRRYLAPGVVDSVLASGEDPTTMPPRRKDVTVLFCDVRGFTAMADQLEPEEVTEVLGMFVAEMGEAVFAHGGTVNKLMGDGVMAVFNDPLEQPDHVERAVRAALEMCERARRLQALLHTRLPEPFCIGVGVHTGPAIVGSVGRGRVIDYTAIGSTVNLASRVQSLATGNTVMVTDAILRELPNRLALSHERRETIRGFAHPIRIAEVGAIRDVAIGAKKASA